MVSLESEQVVWIAETMDKLISGFDFIMANNCVISARKSNLQIHTVEIPFKVCLG